MELKDIQKRLPWDNSTYNEEFLKSNLPHRDMQHAILHINKAVGKLSDIIDATEHIDMESNYSEDDLINAVADIAICAMRIANVEGFSLGIAILNRINEKMGGLLPEK